jgi:Protein of unknown function (DUF2934)
MKTSMTESKTTQTYATQQKPDNRHNEQAASLVPAHDDIAKRAYEIYIKKGRRQGQSERDWKQAENDLRSGRKV